MFSVGDKVRICMGAFKGEIGKVVALNPKNGLYKYAVELEKAKEVVVNITEDIFLELVEDEVVIDKAVYLTGQVTFNNELVNCAVEFGGDANLGNVVVVHLPKNKDISNATSCIYFKYDLEV